MTFNTPKWVTTGNYEGGQLRGLVLVAGYQGLEDGLWRAAWPWVRPVWPWVVFGYHAALISSRLRAVWRLSGSAHASSA